MADNANGPESNQNVLFISNLNDQINDCHLYELFLQAGPLEKVSIQRGFDRRFIGIITYKHEESINYALDVFKGTRLFDHELRLTRDNLLDPRNRIKEAGDRRLQHYQAVDRRPTYESHYENRDRGRERYKPYDRQDDRHRNKNYGNKRYGNNYRNRGNRHDDQRRYY